MVLDHKSLFSTLIFLILSVSWLLPASAFAENQGHFPKLTLRLGLNMPDDTALCDAAERFALLVVERSGGNVQVKVFPNQELGNDHEMIEMVREGDLDMALTPTAKVSPLCPAMQLLDLPFLFPSQEQTYAALDGEPGRLLLKELEPYGLVGLTYWGNGFKQFTGPRPLRTPADFEGLKMRIMKSRILAEQFEALGAFPLPVDFHRTYDALKDGIVDGQENPLVAIVSMRFHEVQPHLTLSNHGYLAYVFYISEKVWDELAPDVRDLLTQTALDVTPWERQEMTRREIDYLRTIEAAGVKVHEPTLAERSALREATEIVVTANRNLIGPHLVDTTLHFLNEKAGRNAHDPD
jgi:C4-dicarboxylate-binding protein DctP